MSSNRAMTALAAMVDTMAHEPLADMDVEVLADDLRGLHKQVSRLQAELLRRLGAFDAVGGAERLPEGGAATTQAWLRRELREAPSAATTLVNAARRLPDLPQVAEAFAAGDISLGHVRVITRTATDWRLDAVQQVEDILVAAARKLHPAELGKCAARIRTAADPEAANKDATRADRRRYLRTGIFDGTLFIEGQVPMAAGGEEIQAALDALEHPDPADTPIPMRRTRAERLADALVDLARLVLNGRATPEVGGERPHATVILDGDVLNQDGYGQAVLEWGGPIPSETARRLLCDSRMTRIITDSEGRPRIIDHSVRTIPRWLRRLLVARDKGCRGPYCDRAPGWCEGHHIVFWEVGGRHELWNLLLVCRRCHMLIHEGGWTVKLLADATAVWTDPAGRTVTTVPDPTIEPAQLAIDRLAAAPP